MFLPEGDAIQIEGWPVQFLPATQPLVAEAVREALIRTDGGLTATDCSPSSPTTLSLKPGRDSSNVFSCHEFGDGKNHPSQRGGTPSPPGFAVVGKTRDARPAPATPALAAIDSASGKALITYRSSGNLEAGCPAERDFGVRVVLLLLLPCYQSRNHWPLSPSPLSQGTNSVFHAPFPEEEWAVSGAS